MPASLRYETSYLLATVQFLRRQEKLDEAGGFSPTCRDPPMSADGDEWWFERRLIARKLLDRGERLRSIRNRAR